MTLTPYRRVLAVPGVRSSMLLFFFARLPMTAMGITMTLHVVGDLGRGYGAAGLVGAAITLGNAVAAPVLGRLIDHYGLRLVTVICGLSTTAFWLVSPYLTFQALVIVALPGGILTVPAGSIARQVLAALVPETKRRTAFSLDTISVEVSFMIGPAVAVFVVTQYSSTLMLTAIGAAFGISSLLLYLMNPPIRNEDEAASHGSEARPPMRSWLRGRFISTLLIAVGALFVLIGTEVASIAALRDTGNVEWTGVVIIAMCVASLVGGLVHGAVHRSLSQGWLVFLLAALTLPVGLFIQPWWLLALALIPMNLMCAPTIAATTETVSKLAPPQVRGEAMGIQDAATRLGLSLGGPAIGFAIDHSSAAWGFFAAGAGALVLAGLGKAFERSVKPEPVLANSSH
ncbi:MFS transporter [Amycolatopsis sp. cg5]|uniref:MFS transporter n=1 Tax=Amycolatopsis sp. cg5 TaxID=3238802 RepID=UPI003525FB1D